MCEIDIGNPKFTKLVQVRDFITFELKVIRHEERETQSFYADCFYICPKPSANYWSGLGGPRKSTFPSDAENQLRFFQIPQILSASGHDVIHLPRPRFLSGNFYFDICEWHILPRAREHMR